MKRIIALIITAIMLIVCTACSGDKPDVSSTLSSAVTSNENSVEENMFKGTYFDTDIWEPVPLMAKEDIEAGYENSEACQMASYLMLDPIDGKLGYYCTDIGGLWRTRDGGLSWEPCNIGYSAGGAACAAIDPNNISRAIVVGANTDYNPTNGIFLTTNGGDTWKEVLSSGDNGYKGVIGIHNEWRTQVAYDETTYDETIGGSAVVYWSRENYPNGSKAEIYNHPAIYKSEDGGESWIELEGSAEMAGGYIAVHPKDSRIVAANSNGAWVSSDGGKAWTKVSDLPFNTLVNVRTQPDKLYGITNDGVYISNDFGKSFTKVESSNFPTGVREASNLRVAPTNPNHMIFLWRGNSGDYDYCTYFTKDGGKTWTASKQDKSGIWRPMASWPGNFWYSPKDENYIIAIEYRSEDGGENFFISTKGYNVICVGGKYSINVNNPNLMALGSQDYNGGFTTDGGKSWKYVNWSGESWGGFTYGAYCLTEKICVTTVSQGWNTPGEITYTKDGGDTVIRTGNIVNGSRSGFGVIGKENICFIGEWRTDDYCETWTKMEGCTVVNAQDPETGRLYGQDKSLYAVVYSDDDGKTWTPFAYLGNHASDLCLDTENDILYAASEGKVFKLDLNSNKNVFGDCYFDVNNVMGMTLDPENPSIIYVVEANMTHRSADGVKRSLDVGKTWTQLIRKVGDGRDNCPDGGHGTHVVFKPDTREIFVTGQCMGVWKMKAAPVDAK